MLKILTPLYVILFAKIIVVNNLLINKPNKPCTLKQTTVYLHNQTKLKTNNLNYFDYEKIFKKSI